MGAAIYTRMSEDKTGKEAGVTRQLKESRDLARRKGIEVVTELSDNDISATTGKRRPAFEQLIQLVESGRIDTVIVWHPDRLYRKLRDLVRLTEIASKTGLTIASVQAGDIDLNTPSGRLNASILGAVATNEGEQRTERQKSAYRQKAEAGEWHFSHRPFGYRREGRAVVLEPAEAEIVRDLMHRYYDTGASRRGLMGELNSRGILTPKGKPWGIIQLRDLLGNSRYAGIASYNGVEVGVKGNWPAIVSEQDWRRWQTKAAKRKRRSTFTTAKHLLSGIARCGVCGSVCYVKYRSGSDTISYACQAKNCVSRGTVPTDSYVEAVAVARLQMPDALESLRPKSEPIEAILSERANVQARLDDLAELVADGTLTAQSARDAAKPLRGKLDALDARIEAVRGVQGLPFDELGADVAGRWSGLTLTQKRAIIRSLMTVTIDRQGGKKTFDPESIRIEWRT